MHLWKPLTNLLLTCELTRTSPHPAAHFLRDRQLDFGSELHLVRDLPGGRRVVYAGRNYATRSAITCAGTECAPITNTGVTAPLCIVPIAGADGRITCTHHTITTIRLITAGHTTRGQGRFITGGAGAGDPWYRYYGYYFAPAPFYPGANLWLTDFILAENLRMAYEAQQNEDVPVRRMAAASPNEVQLTPEVKLAIAEEVKQQLDAETSASARTSAAGSSAVSTDAIPPALDPGTTVFVVASDLDVDTPDGNECELTPGDVISRIDDTPGSYDKVQVRVTASKQGDCARGSKPTVGVADLQDMHNRFREQLDAGLKQLAANQGKNGLPAAPDTSTSAATDVPTPEPDKDVYTQMQGLQKEADEAEQEVKQNSLSPPGGGK